MGLSYSKKKNPPPGFSVKIQAPRKLALPLLVNDGTLAPRTLLQFSYCFIFRPVPACVFRRDKKKLQVRLGRFLFPPPNPPTRSGKSSIRPYIYIHTYTKPLFIFPS